MSTKEKKYFLKWFFRFVAVLLTTKPKGAKGLSGLSTKKRFFCGFPYVAQFYHKSKTTNVGELGFDYLYLLRRQKIGLSENRLRVYELKPPWSCSRAQQINQFKTMFLFWIKGCSPA